MNSLTASFTARIYGTRCDVVLLRNRSVHQFNNRRVTLLPTLTSTRFVCMAEPYLLLKLESAEKTWKDLSVKLADPDIVSNPSEYQKLAQSVSELDVVVSLYQKFKDCEKTLEETQALAKDAGNDQDMTEMISYEIESLSKQLSELEEKLKVLLLPSDPLDERNIMLEVRAGTGGDEAGIWAGDLVGPNV